MTLARLGRTGQQSKQRPVRVARNRSPTVSVRRFHPCNYRWRVRGRASDDGLGSGAGRWHVDPVRRDAFTRASTFQRRAGGAGGAGHRRAAWNRHRLLQGPLLGRSRASVTHAHTDTHTREPTGRRRRRRTVHGFHLGAEGRKARPAAEQAISRRVPSLEDSALSLTSSPLQPKDFSRFSERNKLGTLFV